MLKLKKLIIVQIVNCMPETIDELRPFLTGSVALYSREKLKKVLDLLDQYR